MTLEQIEQQKREGIREYINMTRKYLTAPIIRFYGDEFINLLRGLYVYACGINDHEKPKDYHLYLLIDMSKAKEPNNLNKIKRYTYVEDYPFGEILGGKLHMLTIEVPDKFKNAYDMFLKSKYSQMFSKEDIYKYIVEYIGLTTAAQTMLKTDERLKQFEEEVNYYRKYFTTSDTIDKIANDTTWITLTKDNELDYLIREQEEIFNYKN